MNDFKNIPIDFLDELEKILKAHPMDSHEDICLGFVECFKICKDHAEKRILKERSDVADFLKQISDAVLDAVKDLEKK